MAFIHKKYYTSIILDSLKFIRVLACVFFSDVVLWISLSVESWVLEASHNELGSIL